MIWHIVEKLFKDWSQSTRDLDWSTHLETVELTHFLLQSELNNVVQNPLILHLNTSYCDTYIPVQNIVFSRFHVQNDFCVTVPHQSNFPLSGVRSGIVVSVTVVVVALVCAAAVVAVRSSRPDLECLLLEVVGVGVEKMEGARASFLKR